MPKENVYQDSPVTKKIHTRFGCFEFEESKIIHFSSGLLGFSEYQEYGLMAYPDERIGFLHILQSMQAPELSFFVVLYDEESQIIHQKDFQEAQEKLGCTTDDCVVLFLATCRKKDSSSQNKNSFGFHISINTQAPLFINLNTYHGYQHVFHSDEYDVCRSLF